MEVSSTSMNVARVTVRAMIQGLTAGRQASAWSRGTEAALIYANSYWISLIHTLLIRIPLPQTSLTQTSLTYPDLGFHRHAGAEFVVFVGSRLKHNLYRDALHDFHVIAGGVFGRQQAEAGAAGAGDAINFAFIFAAGGVYLDVDLLTDFHLAMLRLFKVRGNPYVNERNDHHYLLSGSDILSDLGGAIADHAIDRGDN